MADYEDLRLWFMQVLLLAVVVVERLDLVERLWELERAEWESCMTDCEEDGTFDAFCEEISIVETPLVTVAEVGEPKMSLWEATGGRKASLQAYSASLQAYSPSTQVKAAVAHVGDRNWNGEREFLCPTIKVFAVKEEIRLI
jgi:hypothetical protein